MQVFGERRFGGCLCGAVRFSLIGWSDAVHCHCRQCRKASGSLFQTWICAPRRFFRIETVAPPAYRSSTEARRSYCPACGSPLFMDYDGDREISIALGALDDASGIEVRAKIFACERIAQAKGFDAGLVDHPEFAQSG